MEDLERRSAGILQADAALDPAVVTQVLVHLRVRGAGLVEHLPEFGECEVVAHLPADCRDPVGIASFHGDPSCALVHPEVKRIFLGSGPRRESEYLETQLAPPIDVGGHHPYVAERCDQSHRRDPPAQIITRRGPAGTSTPRDASAAA